jgi:hypothetical protein
LWGGGLPGAGPGQAALALALVLARDRSHCTQSPGAYFAGMVRKAGRGELHLDRGVEAA